MPESTRFAKHPDFEKSVLDWVVASDCYEGERVIKERKTTYLPTTNRARFPSVWDMTAKRTQNRPANL